MVGVPLRGFPGNILSREIGEYACAIQLYLESKSTVVARSEIAGSIAFFLFIHPYYPLL